MAVKNEGLPDLEGYLEKRGRHLVTCKIAKWKTGV